MNRMTRWTLCLGVFCLAGCFGGDTGQPRNLVPVTGKVSNDGSPLAGVTLNFLPQGGSQAPDMGAGGTAVTDSEGKFVAMYRGEAEGLAPGQYKVAFSKYVMPNGNPLPPGQSPLDVGAVEGMAAHLADPDQTPITMDVPADGVKDHEILLQAGLAK